MSVELPPARACDRDEIIRLFAGYPFKDYQRRFQEIDPGRLASLLWDMTAPQFDHPHTSARIAWRGQPREAAGFGMVAPHPWHSKVFERPMGRVVHLVNYVNPAAIGPPLLDALLDDARAAGLNHLAARVDGRDWANAQLLESRGFRCVDCSLKMARRIDDMPAEPESQRCPDIEVRPHEPTDLEAVQEIAARSHVHNHFYNDPTLPRAQAIRLFREWIERCARGTATSILTARDADGRIVGFVTLMSNTALARAVGISVGIIDYIVTDAQLAGRGIGRTLLESALEVLAKRHAWAELRTSHDNYRAVNFYLRAGFQAVASDLVFHRWQAERRLD
jgi:ribosomal protein S18 acetylase RimI-like enzyme